MAAAGAQAESEFLSEADFSAIYMVLILQVCKMQDSYDHNNINADFKEGRAELYGMLRAPATSPVRRYIVGRLE